MARQKLHNVVILSLFPGIDLLGHAFEQTGFCVVRGPDIITGGDIRNFSPPANRFDGVIGGPPCQDYSKLNRSPGQYGNEMLKHYRRVVTESKPAWFLYENVVTAPTFSVPEYRQQRFALDLAWFTHFSRRRDFVFGSQSGQLLNPMNGTRQDIQGTCVTGNDERSFQACCDIQGLPRDFDLPFFTLEGKKQAVANAVPMALSLYVAALIAQTIYATDTSIPTAQPERRCKCRCGRVVVGRACYASPACRKRMQRARNRS